jgi:hypothetical protein
LGYLLLIASLMMKKAKEGIGFNFLAFSSSLPHKKGWLPFLVEEVTE